MKPLMVLVLAVAVLTAPSGDSSAGEFFWTKMLKPGRTRVGGEDAVHEQAGRPELPRHERADVIPSAYSRDAGCAEVEPCPQRTPRSMACPHGHHAECRICPQPCPPPAAPAAQPYAAPAMFAAPQARGEIAGESQSVGVRGFAIHFPALHLEFPTIQLPSFVRFRRDAEMRIAEAHAPVVTGAPALYGQLAPGGAAVVQQQLAAPMAAPHQAPCPPAPLPPAKPMKCDEVPHPPFCEDELPLPPPPAPASRPGSPTDLGELILEQQIQIRQLQLELQQMRNLARQGM